MCTGTGGLGVANQIYNRFKSAGKALNAGDIAILDAAEYHYYQVCSTVARSHLLVLTALMHACDAGSSSLDGKCMLARPMRDPSLKRTPAGRLSEQG